MSQPRPAPRFQTLAQVADELNISVAQVRALIRSSDLKAIQVGGRGEWRVERVQLEAYIQQAYRRTRANLAADAALD